MLSNNHSTLYSRVLILIPFRASELSSEWKSSQRISIFRWSSLLWGEAVVEEETSISIDIIIKYFHSPWFCNRTEGFVSAKSKRLLFAVFQIDARGNSVSSLDHWAYRRLPEVSQSLTRTPHCHEILQNDYSWFETLVDNRDCSLLN